MNTEIFTLKSIRTVASISLLASLLGSSLALPSGAQNTAFDLRAQKDESISTDNGLRRSSDVTRPNSDPFASKDNSGPVEQALDPGSFKVAALTPPPPPPPNPFSLSAQDSGQMGQGFALNAQDSGEPEGQMGQGVPDQLPLQRPIQAPMISRPPFVPADPDSTPDMQLLWDAWHHRVAQVIWTNFTSMANTLFAYSPPMAASCAYTVTRNGRIMNVHMTVKNMNPAFNAMVLAAIASIDGNTQLLAFPPGSRRMTVEKSGNFSQNYGQGGFTFTTGDRETIPGQIQRLR